MSQLYLIIAPRGGRGSPKGDTTKEAYTVKGLMWGGGSKISKKG